MAPEKIDSLVPENFQGFLFHYLGVFVPGTSVPLSGRIRIWFQENFQRFLSHYTAKDGARKNCQCCSRKFSGIFVPLSGRICARGFCPTIWTYIANRKIFREFCPTILPKMAPEKIDNFVPENFQGFLSHYLGVFVPGASVPLSGRVRTWFQETFQRFLSHYTAKDGTRKIGNFVPENFQGFLFHYLGVFVPGTSVPLSGRVRIWFQETFQRFLSHYTAKDGAQKKIDNFAPENFQGFLSHYLGVFVPGASVPLSGRILPTGKFSEIFVPLYCQRWRPKKLTILFQKTFRDFCPTIWAYLCQGLLSHYLDVYCQQENFQRFLSHYTAKDGTRKIGNFVPENFQGFLFHYLGVFVPGTSVPLSGRVRIWFQETFQRFLSHYLGVYWGRWRPKNGHLVLKGIFSEAAAAAFSVFSNMVDCSYFAFFDAFVVCCLRPSPSSSSWTSPP